MLLKHWNYAKFAKTGLLPPPRTVLKLLKDYKAADIKRLWHALAAMETMTGEHMARVVAELKIAKVSPHDLRRTVGTEMARLGIPLHVRSLVLNHSPRSRGVTEAVYNRYAYDKEKLEALTAWEEELARLLRAV